MRTRTVRISGGRQRQSGAVAIEFALLFLVLFAALYGTIAFSVPLAIQASLKHLAAEAARSAIRVESSGSGEEVKSFLESYLNSEARTWLPRDWYTGCAGNDFVALGPSQVDICISYQGPQGHKNYNEDPIIPILNLPGIGPVPRLPNSLQGRSSVTLH